MHHLHYVAFNRTNLELKLAPAGTEKTHETPAFNRTNLELKLTQAPRPTLIDVAFNRTNLELKPYNESTFREV